MSIWYAAFTAAIGYFIAGSAVRMQDELGNRRKRLPEKEAARLRKKLAIINRIAITLLILTITLIFVSIRG